MCLPLGCLRCVVEIEAWIILLGGIACFIYTIVLQIQYSQDLKQEGDDDRTFTYGQGLLDAFWITSSCIIVNGIFGVVGGKKKNGCLLFLFNIVNIAIFLAFLVLMILSYVWAGEFGNFTHKNKCVDGTSYVDQVQNYGEDLICSNLCPCYYNQSAIQTPPNTYTNITTNASYPIKVQECPTYNTSNATLQFYANSLEYYEKKYDCTGWCQAGSLKVFYDINSLPSDQSSTCQWIARTNLQDMSMLMGDIAAGLTGLMALMIIFTFCLCCHPTKKEEGFYQRLAYYDEA